MSRPLSDEEATRGILPDHHDDAGLMYLYDIQTNMRPVLLHPPKPMVGNS